MKKLFYLTSGVLLSTSFLSISDANAKMVSKGLITTEAFDERVIEKKVVEKCDADGAVYLMNVNMPNPRFRSVVRTEDYTRLFTRSRVAERYFDKLCETGDFGNVKLLPGPLFRL